MTAQTPIPITTSPLTTQSKPPTMDYVADWQLFPEESEVQASAVSDSDLAKPPGRDIESTEVS